MTDTVDFAQAQLSGEVLFYSRPEPLSKEAHGTLGLKTIEAPYAFTAKSHLVPLTVTEFGPAALCYPIIFVGEQRTPVAVLGVNANENLFVDAHGAYAADCYLPAYVRRYPFVLASDDAREKMVVCIDRDAPMVGDLPDVALFDADGQPTDYTKGCIEFCNNFEVELRRTESFVAMLTELDLFDTRTSTFNPVNPDGSPAGPPQVVAEYYAVSEEKLRELMNSGALPQIYAHLTSLAGWERLITLAFRRTPQSAPANLN
jgi:hypothetical protein